jgi:Protein of unknown function (DUF3239)
MQKKRTYTTDNSTFASNPGNVTFDPWCYYTKSYPMDGVALFVLIIVSIALVSISLPNPLLFLVFLLIPFVFLLKRKQEHFKFGDSNPGIVIKTSPILVAVMTDLRKRNESYPVVKIIKVPLKNVRIGTKVGTVALYEGTVESIPHWSDFHPIVVNCATRNLAEIEAAIASYTPKQFSDLEDGILQLQEPYKEGLYKIHNEYSRW